MSIDATVAHIYAVQQLQRMPKPYRTAAAVSQRPCQWRSGCCLQDVFALPGHLALVMQWANCGGLRAYVTSYMQDNVRLRQPPHI